MLQRIMKSILLILLSLDFGRLVTAQYNICPPGRANNIHDVFGQANSAQEGVWHRLSCPTFRSGEALDGVAWHRGPSLDDPSTVGLINYFLGGTNRASDRYEFSSDFSLVVKNITKSDEGRYLCDVEPRDTNNRVGKVDINIIGKSFSSIPSDSSVGKSFEQGRRQTIPCECASDTPGAPISVVYWSMGEGITTDTEIIGAHFSDGTVLQIQHGADYSIGSDASLTVNSLNDVQDTQRFWCHAFHQDGTLSNCYTDVEISGTKQVLPCTIWTPSVTTCEIKWIKLDNSEPNIVLIFNVSSDVEADSPYDLASDFGLAISRVDVGHAGTYRCTVGVATGDIEVRVIGKEFPLDDGTATGGDPLTYKPDTRLTLQCLAAVDIGALDKATLFWSFGGTNAQKTTVIGRLNLPRGSKTMSDLGDNSCFGISLKGSLTTTNCSQDGDVRYWCHVFPKGGMLMTSYVDVLVETSIGKSSYIVIIIVCACLFTIMLLVIGVVLGRRRKRSSHYRGDKERGGYRKVDHQGPVPELDVKGLVKKVKQFVLKIMGKIPITPWMTGDDAGYARIDDVYTPLELFHNVYTAGGNVRYRLESNLELFDDGISELSSRHVLIRGRSGCGKTTFLYMLAYDWSKGRDGKLLDEKKLVFPLPARVLIEAGNLGQAVVQHLLPSNTKILASSINNYCQRHPNDVVILVDGCDDKTDFTRVMEIFEEQGALECQLVITTRQGQLAQNMSQKYKMRRITITGFTPENAHMYVDKILDISRDYDPAKKEKHTDAQNKTNTGDKPTNNNTDDTHGNTQPGKISKTPDAKNDDTDSNHEKYLDEDISQPKDKPTSINTDDAQRNTSPPKANKIPDIPSSKLHRFLDEDILQPEVLCLPANLSALSQLSVWTKGEAFLSGATMCDIFTSLVKCLFKRSNHVAYVDAVQEATVTTSGCGLGDNLSVSQRGLLIELGKVVLPKLTEHREGPVTLSELDLLNSSERGKEVLGAALKIGILSHGKEVNEKTENLSIQKMSETGSRMPFLYRKQEADRDHEIELLKQDAKVYFVLEILEQVCAGLFLALSKESVNTWLDRSVRQIAIKKTLVEKLSNLIAIACLDSLTDQSAVIAYLGKIINSGRRQNRSLRNVLWLQKLLVLSLLLNFEGKCMGALNAILSPLFEEGRVRLIGISRHRIRLLTYLLKYSQEGVDGSRLDVKSIELFRIGRLDRGELREYCEYFARGSTTVGSKTSSEPAEAWTSIAQSKLEIDQSQSPQVVDVGEKTSTMTEFESKAEQQSDDNQRTSSASEVNGMAVGGENQRTDGGQPNSDIQSLPLSHPTGVNAVEEPKSEAQQSEVNKHVHDSASKTDVTTVAEENSQRDTSQPEIKKQPSLASSTPGVDKKSSEAVTESKPEKLDNNRQTDSTSQLDVTTVEGKSENEAPGSADIVPPVFFKTPSPDSNRASEITDGSQQTKHAASQINVSTVAREDQTIEPHESTVIDAISSDYKLTTLNKLREKIESRDKDFPLFPSDQSYVSVLHTVQSLGLQELLESQSGECYSSRAASDLVRCLPGLVKLEEIVLVGTILCSDDLVDLAGNMNKLPKLKKLDLRLNKLFDDKSFQAIAKSLHACTELTDLMLSLYGVTAGGFDCVQMAMDKDEGRSWRRLRTLYLLHGSPPEALVRFISGSAKYLHSAEYCHISASVRSGVIQANILNDFQTNVTKFMPNLMGLDTGNIDELKPRVASLKLPKKKKRKTASIMQTLEGTMEDKLANPTPAGKVKAVAEFAFGKKRAGVMAAMVGGVVGTKVDGSKRKQQGTVSGKHSVPQESEREERQTLSTAE